MAEQIEAVENRGEGWDWERDKSKNREAEKEGVKRLESCEEDEEAKEQKEEEESADERSQRAPKKTGLTDGCYGDGCAARHCIWRSDRQADRETEI